VVVLFEATENVEVVRAVDFVESGEHRFLGALDLEAQIAEAAAANDDLLDLAETSVRGALIDGRRLGLSVDAMSGTDRREQRESAQDRRTKSTNADASLDSRAPA
jgi:hypothetical protein